MPAKKGHLTGQLFDALRARNLGKVRELLRQGADPNARPEGNSTLLEYAVVLYGPGFVRCLVDAGADARDPEVLLDAVRQDKVEAARVLLEAGADPNTRDDQGNSVLALACQRHNAVALARVLLDAGAEPDPPRGTVPLHTAVGANRPDLVRLLVSRGADVNRSGDDGLTPLVRALQFDQYRYVPAQRRAAERARNEAVVKLLRRHGAEEAGTPPPLRDPPARPLPLRRGVAGFRLESGGGFYSLFAPRVLDRPLEELADMSYESRSAARVRRELKRAEAFAVGLVSDTTADFRVALRELTDQEAAEWVGRVVWQLDLSDGVLGVCGGGVADADVSGHAAVYVRVPPGRYRVEVYCFLPHSTAYGLLGFEKRGAQPPGAYFRATRPGGRFPAWLQDWCVNDPGDDPGHEGEWAGVPRKERDRLARLAERYVDFLIRLAPLGRPPAPPKFDRWGHLKWETRRPKRCPLGIRT